MASPGFIDRGARPSKGYSRVFQGAKPPDLSPGAEPLVGFRGEAPEIFESYTQIAIKFCKKSVKIIKISNKIIYLSYVDKVIQRPSLGGRYTRTTLALVRRASEARNFLKKLSRFWQFYTKITTFLRFFKTFFCNFMQRSPKLWRFLLFIFLLVVNSRKYFVLVSC